MLSDTSLLHARPCMPGMSTTLRSNTSAQIISIIRNSSTQARSASVASSLPYSAESRSMGIQICRVGPAEPGVIDRPAGPGLPGEQLFHSDTVFRARLDRGSPAHLVGLVDVLL